MHVFCISTGRSGTHTLFKLFQAFNDTLVTHENVPMGNDRKLYTFSDDVYNADFIKSKVIAIKDRVQTHYIETNHLFIKAFYPIVNKLDDVKVIYLYRDPDKVVKSLMALKTIPGKSMWYLNPQAENNIIKCIGDSDKDKCEWYVNEISERYNKFIKDYENIPLYSVNIDELNDIDHVEKLLNWINIPYDLNKIKSIIGRKFNVKHQQKKNKRNGL